MFSSVSSASTFCVPVASGIRETAPLDCPRPSPNKNGAACRLQKFLASCGVGSRRACERLISQGHVAVNGTIVSTQGTSVDPSKDKVTVDGKPVESDKKISILFHKPRGVVTTCHDTHARKTFGDFLPDFGAKLHPAGRLDMDSEGLLLLTNDGELTQKVTHPSHELTKTYEAWSNRRLAPQDPATLMRGIQDEGELLKAVKIETIRESANSFQYRIILAEGRKRQVRRMFKAVGKRVVRLQRTAIGPIKLGKLASGEWRFLTDKERDVLM